MDERIKNWDLYTVTDLAMADGKSYPEMVDGLLAGGARVIQLRNKSSTFEELVEVGPSLLEKTRAAAAQLIINDNPYLAREIDADGVHLGQNDFPVDLAREIVGSDKLIGLSTHTKPQANQATLSGADYIGLGPIYNTTTKKMEYNPRGLEIVRWAAEKLDIPFVCIGGITLDNLPDVLAAGARCCAVISGIMKQGDLAEAVRQHRKVFTMLEDV